MTANTENSSAQDSEDLEALFDSIVAANRGAGAQAKGTVASHRTKQNPRATAEESLNSSLRQSELSVNVEQRSVSPHNTAPAVQPSDVINRIGHVTRTLHNALRELGLSKKIEKAASSIPDARDRLNYVATLTEQAAERVLNATEAAQPLVEKMEVEAHYLSGQWQLLLEKKLDAEQFKSLAAQTHAFLQQVPKQTKATHAYLMEIMMAQDFQDLTGQVIKKIIEVTENVEQQLLALLVENAQPSVRGDLDGPVINPTGHKDILSNQRQVDDLLESLGF